MQPLKNKPAKHHLLIRWQPKTIQKPIVDPKLQELDALSRSTECIRYSLLSTEYWLEPSGRLREWIRANTRFAVCIAAPTFMALPIATLALWEFESSMNALTTIAGKLVFLPILALLAFISITVVCRILRTFKP